MGNKNYSYQSHNKNYSYHHHNKNYSYYCHQHNYYHHHHHNNNNYYYYYHHYNNHDNSHAPSNFVYSFPFMFSILSYQCQHSKTKQFRSSICHISTMLSILQWQITTPLVCDSTFSSYKFMVSFVNFTF